MPWLKLIFLWLYLLHVKASCRLYPYTFVWKASKCRIRLASHDLAIETESCHFVKFVFTPTVNFVFTSTHSKFTTRQNHKIFAGVKENIKFVNEFHFVTFVADCTTTRYSNIWEVASEREKKTSANKYVQHLCVQSYAELCTILEKYLHLALKMWRGQTIQFYSLFVLSLSVYTIPNQNVLKLHVCQKTKAEAIALSCHQKGIATATLPWHLLLPRKCFMPK